jgi:hypothetical protein
VPKRIQELARKGERWLHQKHEIARFEDIALVDLEDYTPYFRRTVVAALQLIKDTDPRRYARLRRHIASIVNCTRPFGGAGYFYETKTCEIDFDPRPSSEYEVQFYAAWYACTLVHEATHGVLRSHGIPYAPENRVQIEKLCMSEEQRFARHLTVDSRIVTWLQHKLTFDPARWHAHWTTTRWQKFLFTIRRVRSRYREEDRRRREEGRVYHIPS